MSKNNSTKPYRSFKTNRPKLCLILKTLQNISHQTQSFVRFLKLCKISHIKLKALFDSCFAVNLTSNSKLCSILETLQYISYQTQSFRTQKGIGKIMKNWTYNAENIFSICQQFTKVWWRQSQTLVIKDIINFLWLII